MASAHHALFFFLLLSSSLCLPFFTTSATQKVSLAIYYEALCPFCSRFIVLSLSKIFSDGLISIVDLRLVPYGNALIGPNHTISCQHGPSECFLNTVEACAINSWSDVVELQYAAQTNALQPPHRYVPWVVVNGLPLYDDYDNFETYICESFHGELPSACRRLSLKIPQQMKPKRADRRCVMNDTVSSSATNKH